MLATCRRRCRAGSSARRTPAVEKPPWRSACSISCAVSVLLRVRARAEVVDAVVLAAVRQVVLEGRHAPRQDVAPPVEQVVVPLHLEEVAVLDHVPRPGVRKGPAEVAVGGVRLRDTLRRLVARPRRLLRHRADAGVHVGTHADVDRAALVQRDRRRLVAEDRQDQDERRQVPHVPIPHRTPSSSKRLVLRGGRHPTKGTRESIAAGVERTWSPAVRASRHGRRGPGRTRSAGPARPQSERRNASSAS